MHQQKQPPEELFHYTSPAGLKGISQFRQFWASNIRYLNDATEYLHSIKLARSLVPELHGLSTVESGFFEFLLGEPRSGVEQTGHSAGLQYFVVSLSGHQDSLSQWRTYAGRNGYAIGWRRTVLQKLAHSAGFELKPCNYDLDDQRRCLQALLESTLEMWREVKGFDSSWWLTPERADPVVWQRVLGLQEVFDARLSDSAVIFKDPAFIEENEWRLVGRGISWKQPLTLEFREGRTVLIPYTQFFLDVDRLQDEARTVICCGPNPEPMLAEQSVRLMFGRHGWPPIDVRHSIAPYRDW